MYTKQAHSSNFQHITNLIPSMFDRLHRRNIKLSEYLKNESIAPGVFRKCTCLEDKIFEKFTLQLSTFHQGLT